MILQRSRMHFSALTTTDFSAYWYIYRINNNGKDIQPGITIDHILDLYEFDRNLRLLVLDAIERIEIALRTDIAYYHSKDYGPFGYINSISCSKDTDLIDRLRQCRDNVNNSHSDFYRHYRGKYQNQDFPIWMLVETISFDLLVRVYKILPKQMKFAIANKYGLPARTYSSWMSTLKSVRNTCAHHGRLWNTKLSTRPQMPGNMSTWQSNIQDSDSIFMLLTVCKYFLDFIDPNNTWRQKAIDLISVRPNDQLQQMGVPQNWANSPMWK